MNEETCFITMHKMYICAAQSCNWNLLKEYNLILGQEKCRQSYGFIQEGHICAGNYNFGGKDSCQGDSGGALWWKHPTTQQIYQVCKDS